MQFFSLERPFIAWGDYGDILHHGMASLDEQGDLLKLERTGTFAPPISFPGINDIVVTHSFRLALETSNLTGFSFRPVIKHHIVNLDWSEWKGEEPDFYPESGEPEDYISEAQHSPETADQMPEFWELMIAPLTFKEPKTHRQISESRFHCLKKLGTAKTFSALPKLVTHL